MANPLQAGDKAPNFSMPSTEGDISLKDFEGSYLVLYFYPRDNTPGCTTEAKDFTALVDEFGARNAKIVGVSRDSMTKHENFKAKQGFPFELICDKDERLCQLFDVIKLKKLYGKEYLGIDRSTFLIDHEGLLRQEWRGVKVPGHVEAVLQAAQALQQR